MLRKCLERFIINLRLTFSSWLCFISNYCTAHRHFWTDPPNLLLHLYYSRHHPVCWCWESFFWMVSQTYTAATVLIGYIHRPLSSLHIWADCCTSIEIQSVFLIVKSQGGTNTLCLVSEGCLTLFVCCINVSLPCKARLFSFLYLLLCLKYIILLLLLTKKAGCSLSLSLASRSAEIEYCI